MSLAARLSRLTPALSGRQRALLVIHASLLGEEPDKAWLDVPADQRREYDYYVALHYTSNMTLGLLCHILSAMVGALERDLEQHDLLGKAAAMLEEDLPQEVAEELVREMRGDGRTTVPEFLRRLQNELRQKVLDEVKLHFQELRSLELLWQEIADECDGQDLRNPELTELAGQTRDRLVALAQTLGARRRLAQPSDEVLAGVRKHVDEAMRMMSYREPE